MNRLLQWWGRLSPAKMGIATALITFPIYLVLFWLAFG